MSFLFSKNNNNKNRKSNKNIDTNSINTNNKNDNIINSSLINYNVIGNINLKDSINHITDICTTRTTTTKNNITPSRGPKQCGG